MAEAFQRLFARADPQVLSMNVQAALGPVRAPQRSQFSHLLRHFFERFFNHESASPDGDAKTRMVQIACAAGLPPFVVAIYLWPLYHPIAGWPPGRASTGAPPTYWLQVNHHFFFILYSFVAVGIATVFVWDLFFPDLLDLFVLGTLPIEPRRIFFARITSIAIFVAGFLFDTTAFAAVVLPMAIDPPNLARFLAGHLVGVVGSGLFAALSILAIQGLLLAILGERVFRKVSLVLQGLTITALVMLMLLFPVLTGVVPTLFRTGNLLVRVLPPFWFLALDQRVLEGAAALPLYSALARSAVIATGVTGALVLLTYPLAYLRRMRQLLEGPPAHAKAVQLLRPLANLLHSAILRQPLRRAIFHFISQTLLRVPRYRIYLVLYGGVGLSVVTASILRFTTDHQNVRVGVSADGIRAAVAIVAFWMVAGFRMAFVSSGNQRGRWVFRVIHGSPPPFETALGELETAQTWVLLWSCIVAFGALVVFRFISPPELLTWQATAAQVLISAGFCLLLTDAFFLNVTYVAFTGEVPRVQPNLAFTVLKYFTFFPFVSALPVGLEPWIASSVRHFASAAIVLACVHLLFRHRHGVIVRDHCNQIELEEDEEDFPMKLGLRY